MSDELREQFGIFREMGVLMGGPAYVQIVSSTFPTKEQAEAAAERIPRLRGVPTIIRKRKTTEWEEA